MSKRINYLLHCYSPENSGDGLLVKLSLDKIQSERSETIRVVALDSNKFTPYLSSYKNITIHYFINLFFLMFYDFMRGREIYVYGVGGGYLRSPNLYVGAKTLIAHGSQILLGSVFAKKTHYFAQSIGPFNSFTGSVLLKLLRNISVLEVRDDKTKKDLVNLRNVTRKPDLVVSSILNNLNYRGFQPCSAENIYLVLRDIPESKGREHYLSEISKLMNKIGNLTLAVQSNCRGNNDEHFYEKMFNKKYKIVSTQEAFKDKNGLIISVRLHGSLEAILNGVPSIHIAYERKGKAAYDDLNIIKYCHHVSNFSADDIFEQIQELKNDHVTFKKSVEGSKWL